jgi:hypothetical protein
MKSKILYIVALFCRDDTRALKTYVLHLNKLNKCCSKILHVTLLNSVSNDSLPFIAGQSQDSFTLVKCQGFAVSSVGYLSAVHGIQTVGTLELIFVSCLLLVTCVGVHD